MGKQKKRNANIPGEAPRPILSKKESKKERKAERKQEREQEREREWERERERRQLQGHAVGASITTTQKKEDKNSERERRRDQTRAAGAALKALADSYAHADAASRPGRETGSVVANDWTAHQITPWSDDAAPLPEQNAAFTLFRQTAPPAGDVSQTSQGNHLGTSTGYDAWLSRSRLVASRPIPIEVTESVVANDWTDHRTPPWSEYAAPFPEQNATSSLLRQTAPAAPKNFDAVEEAMETICRDVVEMVLDLLQKASVRPIAISQLEIGKAYFPLPEQNEAFTHFRQTTPAAPAGGDASRTSPKNSRFINAWLSRPRLVAPHSMPIDATLLQQQIDDIVNKGEQERAAAGAAREVGQQRRGMAYGELHEIELANGESRGFVDSNGQNQANLPEAAEPDEPVVASHATVLAAFPNYCGKLISAIANNTFAPEDLPRFLDISGGLAEENEQLHGPLENFGDTSYIWSRTFLIWMTIFSSLHANRFGPALLQAMIEFHNRITKLSEMYEWKDAVLPLAIFHQRRVLQGNPFLPQDWIISEVLIYQYTCGYLRHLDPTVFRCESSQLYG